MQHSYEGLDRGGGYSRVGLLAPLRHRDFRLLWSGMCISLLGDGVFFVLRSLERPCLHPDLDKYHRISRVHV